jgi:ribose transport system permease protein
MSTSTQHPEAVAAGTDPPDGAVAAGPSLKSRILQSYGMLVIFAAMIVVFSLLRPETFATSGNFTTIVNNQPVLVILALGAMITLVVGGFDLSLPSTLSLSSALAVGLQVKSGIPWVPVLIICLLLGLAIGLINGLIIARGGLNSFVVTLATSTILIGFATWYTGGQVLFGQVDAGFKTAGQGTLLGFVHPVFLALALVIGLWYLLEHTPIGRQMYAAGSNPDAARLSGVPTSSLTVLAFVVAGGLAALAGAVQAAKLGSAQPDIGAGFLLPAFASAFLGASVIRIGRFNPIGTLIGVLLVATGFSGLTLLGVEAWVQPIFYGVVLLLAIGTPALLASLRGRARAAPGAASGG